MVELHIAAGSLHTYTLSHPVHSYSTPTWIRKRAALRLIMVELHVAAWGRRGQPLARGVVAQPGPCVEHDGHARHRVHLGRGGERRDGEVPVETLEMRTAMLNLLAARQLVDRNSSSSSDAVLRRA